MKSILPIFIFSALMLCVLHTNGQSLNWTRLDSTHRHFIGANAGAEYGMVYGLSYGYKITQGSIPVIAGLDVSAPSGKNLIDDFKVRAGGQIRWIKAGNFQLTTQLYGVFRRTENDYVRILNFGSDFAGVIGYYRTKWYVSGMFGFDKAIVSEFKHKPAYLDQFPGAVDGWYEPTTGGNFYYGLEAGYSFKGCDLYVKAGQLVTQDWKTSPLLPYYGKVGVTVHL